jgi:hypothetical protein
MVSMLFVSFGETVRYKAAERSIPFSEASSLVFRVFPIQFVGLPNWECWLQHNAEGELQATATIQKIQIVQSEGARKVSLLVQHCYLNAILAVGYRVRSDRGTAFRQWATVLEQAALLSAEWATA